MKECVHIGKTFDPPLQEVPAAPPPHGVRIRHPIPTEMGLRVGTYSIELTLRDAQGRTEAILHTFDVVPILTVDMTRPTPLVPLIGRWSKTDGLVSAQGSTAGVTFASTTEQAFSSYAAPARYELSASIRFSLSEESSYGGVVFHMMPIQNTAQVTYTGPIVRISGDRKLIVLEHLIEGVDTATYFGPEDISTKLRDLNSCELTLDCWQGYLLIHVDGNFVGRVPHHWGTFNISAAHLGLTYYSRHDNDHFGVSRLVVAPSRYYFWDFEYVPTPV